MLTSVIKHIAAKSVLVQLPGKFKNGICISGKPQLGWILVTPELIETLAVGQELELPFVDYHLEPSSPEDNPEIVFNWIVAD
jgi:uncharacterized protein (DUF2237 family)